MTILLIEDDGKTSQFLRQGLAENGFDVETAVDASEGLRLAQARSYDLIVLDSTIRGLQDRTALTELRSRDSRTPVLLLTAPDSLEVRLSRLDPETDGCVAKPFAFTEVLATIRTLLRREAGQGRERIRIADLELDLASHHASRGGRAIPLTDREIDLLALLLRRTGEIVPPGLISDQVWGMVGEPNTDVVEMHMRRLRAKIDDPFKIKLIHSVRGIGYVLEPRG